VCQEKTRTRDFDGYSMEIKADRLRYWNRKDNPKNKKVMSNMSSSGHYN
jgi:hypothetical protein